MGKGKAKPLREFIEGIPDSKLSGFPDKESTLHKDGTFRCDMQGKTASGEFNLQVQVNSKPKITSYRKDERQTVAGAVLAPGDNSMTSEQIKTKLKETSRY